MIKIFQYECKRLLWNKFFFGLLLILLFYGWQVLNSVTILGVSHTAPFSPWSFGDYLSRMLPLLWIGTLFFLTFYTSPKARRAAVLMDATPMPPKQYALVRCAAALTGGVLLSLLCMGEAAAACLAGTAGGVFCSQLWRPFCPPLCSHWGAAGCWGRSGPGWCMCGWLSPSCVWPCRCPTPWESGTDIFSVSTL